MNVSLLNWIPSQSETPSVVSNDIVSNRSNQRKEIMNLLRKGDIVLTNTLIKKGFYQYNARIYELRRGVLDGVSHKIVACKDALGRCGFSLVSSSGVRI